MIDPRLPLIDLHRHLDGSVRLETILDLGIRHNLDLPSYDLEGLQPFVQVTEAQPDILAFFKKFEWQTKVMVDRDACRRIAYENVLDAAQEGIDYIELRFSPWFMAEAHHLQPAGVVEAVVDGIEAGRQATGVRVNLIGILSRTYGPQTAWQELEALLTQKDRLVGLDLAGDEAHFPGELFVDHFKRGREAGWRITVHAGEASGPESIWQAVKALGAERIGHAVRAPEDPALLDYLAKKRIGIESSLTSNVQTSTVAGYDRHPLKLFLERGIPATLNTDDPGISAINLHYEYEVAAPAAGLSPGQIHQAQQNALEVAFLSQAEKDSLI
jgi:adenosine deaminase